MKLIHNIVCQPRDGYGSWENSSISNLECLCKRCKMPSSIRLEGLQTEGRNSSSNNIDQVETLELCRILNHEDATVASAVEKCVPIIAKAIDALEPKVRKGGRVVYVGAGTSGRYCNHPLSSSCLTTKLINFEDWVF